MSHKTLTWSPAAQDPSPFYLCLPCKLTLSLLLVSLLVLVMFPVLYAFLFASSLFASLPYYTCVSLSPYQVSGCMFSLLLPYYCVSALH